MSKPENDLQVTIRMPSSLKQQVDDFVAERDITSMEFIRRAIREKLTSLDGSAAKKELDEKGAITFTAGDTEISLGVEDLLIETVQKEGYHAESGNGVTVILDTNLTDELIEEGFVREIISKIQTMRKDSGFEVMDRINVYTSGNDKIASIMTKNAELIKDEVLADEIKICDFESSKEWNINGEKVNLGVEKI